MAKRSSVTATYKPCADSVFQVVVEAGDAYPDGLDEARAQAVRGVTELIYASLGAYGSDVDDPADP